MPCILKIPYVDLALQNTLIKDELLAAVGSVLESGQLIIGGEVRQFEARFAEWCGVAHAVGVNSGTDALIIALRALGVGEGDEVITTANSFVTTASSVACVGAKPVFVDVRDDFNIDPDLIEAAITANTKAIIPVHLTGRPADMGPIMKIAKRHGLFVIEDCAQAVCAEISGRRVGSFGDVGCFSLHPLKTLNACGDGGVLVTNNPDFVARFKLYRDNGIHNRNFCKVWSSNSRLDTVQAAMLLVKMKYTAQWIKARRDNADLYRTFLAGVAQVKCPVDREGEFATYHTFIIQAENRDKLQTNLAEQGIETCIHYPIPIHLQEAAKDLGYKEGDLPVTERQSKAILSLPVYPELARENIQYIAKCIQEFYQKKESA